MTDNGAIETFEVERKYEAADEARLPELWVFEQHGFHPDESQHHELTATYFDTEGFSLAERRIALRMRVGGKDEGWHLKMKGESGARELLWPPAETMPEGLRAELEAILGQEAAATIAPIASLQTDRSTTLLRSGGGEPVVELADDRVRAVNEITGRRQQWREWEAELMPEVPESVLDEIEPLLLSHGATRVRGTSKIQRTMQAE